MKKGIYFIFLFLVAASAVQGQYEVAGKVTDIATGEPLGYVSVGISGKAEGTVTNEAGRYKLVLTKGDSITLRFSIVGYNAEERTVCFREEKRMTVDVSLKAKSKNLDEVEVKGSKNRQGGFTKIETAHIDATVGPSEGVEGILKTLPDVNSNNELSSQYSVRGGSFDENLVYINGVEVFRPMLIRSGQQEGMSIINPDMVDYLLFSPGGFDATYGDKMSSVLDITYRPESWRKGVWGKVSGSLLGASVSIQGNLGEKWSFASGVRQHSNRYVLSSLDTKGSYTTNYTDVQAWARYAVNERLDINFIALWTRNIYGLIPESSTTAFNQRTMELNVYFDGAEEDRYRTLLGGATIEWRPTEEWIIDGSLSAQNVQESERYDIQSQYWLYQVGMGETVGETELFDRGVGTFLEHARNRMNTEIYSGDVRATKQARLGEWKMGAKIQVETVDDRMREWRLVDSAGYALPYIPLQAGDSANMPSSPILQKYANSFGGLQTFRTTAYIQRSVEIDTKLGEMRFTAGVRGGGYQSILERYAEEKRTGWHTLISPRFSVGIVPKGKKNLTFRLSGGIYKQAPFYREYRREDGSLNEAVVPQTSYQLTSTTDWDLRIWTRPFRLTTDIYYKYITDLIPYTVDNLRVSYQPDLEAKAYAAGVSIRINGEFVEGLESWASISLMRTQEDIAGDEYGWLDRPTDQRFAFKMFLQDYVPELPWWKMSLSAIYATGMPISTPYGQRENALRLPSYFRLDWGNTVQLARVEKIKHKRIFKYVDDIQVGVEVFNLFNRQNVVSYLWVSDYDNRPYRVPNYLTARQINIKLTVLF